MELNYQVTTIEEVEEQFRGLYEKNESGVFVLKVNGVAPKEKVDEFRGNNIELQKKLDQLQADIDNEKKKKTEQTAIEKGESAQVIAEKQRIIDELLAEKESLTGKVGTYEERFKEELSGILEQLPEEMRGDFDGIDTQKAIKLAGNALTLISKKKPFDIPPKEVGRFNTDVDLSTLSASELLSYHRQKAKGA